MLTAATNEQQAPWCHPPPARVPSESKCSKHDSPTLHKQKFVNAMRLNFDENYKTNEIRT